MKTRFLLRMIIVVVLGTMGRRAAASEIIEVFSENFNNISNLSSLVEKGWSYSQCYFSSGTPNLQVKGYAVTNPINNLDGKATLTFKCKTDGSSYKNDLFVVTILKGSVEVKRVEITVNSNTYQDETITFQGLSGMQIKFESGTSGHIIRLDDIVVNVERLSSPSFTFYEGYYQEARTTTIINNETGATIYYTTDGTEPTNASTQYTSAITIDRPITLKAIAYKGDLTSSVTTARYYVGRHIFGESFNKFNATGGNDGKFVENSVVATVSSLDNTSASITNVNAAYKCVELKGSGTNDGVFTTPSLDLGKSAVLKFRVAGTTGGDKSLKVTLSESDTQNSTTNFSRTFTAKSGEWTEYSMGLSTLRQNSTQTVSFSGKGCFLDEVLIVSTAFDPVVLSESDDAETTASLLASNAGQVRDVQLTRTLPANTWNTLCLPFTLYRHDLLALSETFTGTDVDIFIYTSFDNNQMKFTSVTEVPAGTPFLLRMTSGFTNPTFRAVTIENVEAQEVTDGDVSFVGIYNPTNLNTDGTHLYLGTDNNLYSPAAGKNTIKGLRAYIVKPAALTVRLAMDNESAGIQMVEASNDSSCRWYTLSGQQVKAPQKKGLYVTEGKKVIIR